MKEKTYEGTKKTQNGLKRMFFSVLAILLQAVFHGLYVYKAK